MVKLRTDVLVVGGGTSGVTAAIAAAEEGVQVTLVERDSALGGVGVRAGIHAYYYGSPGGIQDELDELTHDLNKRWGGKAIGLHPEAKGAVIEQKMAQLGIRVVYEATVAEVLLDGTKVVGAIVESEQDRITIEAAVTIDCTGDGDAAFLAGASYTLGREWDGCQHAYSLIPRFVNEKHVLRYKNYDLGWIDVTDCADVSRAYRMGRRYAWRGSETPENTHFLVLGPQLGVREGRRITGAYILRQDDLLLDKRFDDVVMRCYAHHENHAYDYANESDLSQIWIGVLGKWKFLFGGDVPYRCLLPETVDGLLIGCRALSQDHDCGNLFRMQRDMQKLGEVAGVAAAMSVNQEVPSRQVDVHLLQRKLIARGVLNEADLTRESSPWLTFAGETGDDRQRVIRNGAQVEDIQAIIRYLGTEEEPTALWWLWHFGESSIPPLLDASRLATGRIQRGIAFALGLLKHPDSVPCLVETFRSGAQDKPNELDRTMESWMSALVLLRRMGDASVVEDVLQLLPAERSSTTLLLFLHYLISISGQLNDSQKQRAQLLIRSVISDSEIGNDYTLHGSGVSIPATPYTRSIKWSIDVTSFYLLEMLGGEGRSLLQQACQDDRGYVRVAAATLLARLKPIKGGK
ncbi:FAD-dependent oxidoreductase [Paenibacillus sp. HJGM_3]|uniref:FAD-dependent oxidoreductase n=1 Tax=Paenibacillus sp. HJGM_3 TaxID=3379816 RepID=UPI00385E03DD